MDHPKLLPKPPVVHGENVPFVMDPRTVCLVREGSRILKPKWLDESHTTQSLQSTYLDHSLSSIVPESDVLLRHHWGEAGGPPSISGHVLLASGVDAPKVLQASRLQNQNQERQ
jgi:hypothetical protein